MRSLGLHRLAAGAVVILLSVALAGCWNPFAPEGGGDAPPTVIEYRLRTTPSNVVHNLQSAYKDKNLEEYLDCLAEDFEFFLNPDDVTPGSGLPESWGKSEESNIHEAMFSEVDTIGVDRIELTLTNLEISFDPGELPEDPSDDRYTHKEETDLRVTVGDLTLLANADQEFVFQIDPNETGPDGETLWEIIEWWDLEEDPGGRAPADGNADRVSVSELKAMFR
ncbi:MAG: hypothetical protein GF400_03880 [Candidatus Eisenbacteria bacterium]|nr:hypothetical protein [Candidatus Eisenbacteria bacterium]